MTETTIPKGEGTAFFAGGTTGSDDTGTLWPGLEAGPAADSGRYSGAPAEPSREIGLFQFLRPVAACPNCPGRMYQSRTRRRSSLWEWLRRKIEAQPADDLGIGRHWVCEHCDYSADDPVAATDALFVGGTSAGKSTLIGAITREATANPITWLNLTQDGRFNQLTAFIDRDEVVGRTQPNEERMFIDGRRIVDSSASIPADGIYQMRFTYRNGAESERRILRMLDMPGEKAEPDIESLVNHAPGVWRAPLIVLCVDPAQLIAAREDHLISGGDPEVLTPSALASLILALSTLRSAGNRAGGAPVHLAFVVMKSDLLRDRPGFPAQTLDEVDYDSLGPSGTRLRLERDSDAARDYLRARPADGGLGAAQAVAAAVEYFDTTSFHFVSSTMCSPNPETNKYDAVKPRRTRDPFLLHWLEQRA